MNLNPTEQIWSLIQYCIVLSKFYVYSFDSFWFIILEKYW